MNIHVPEQIQNKWSQYEFIGVPFEYKDGRKMIRAHHKVLGMTHYYSFEEDCCWFDFPEHLRLKKA